MINFVFMDDDDDEDYNKKTKKKKEIDTNHIHKKIKKNYDDMKLKQKEYYENWIKFYNIIQEYYPIKLDKLNEKEIINDLIDIVINFVNSKNYIEETFILESEFYDNNFYMGDSEYSNNIRKRFQNKLIFNFQIQTIVNKLLNIKELEK